MVVRSLKGDITEESVYIIYNKEPIATLIRRMNDACEEEYVFVIDWDTYDKTDLKDDQFGIPGLNMYLRQKEYVRPFVPSFIHEHMPPKGREDIPYYMEKYGLTGEYDMWDLMCASHRHANDPFTVCRVEEWEEYRKTL